MCRKNGGSRRSSATGSILHLDLRYAKNALLSRLFSQGKHLVLSLRLQEVRFALILVVKSNFRFISPKKPAQKFILAACQTICRSATIKRSGSQPDLRHKGELSVACLNVKATCYRTLPRKSYLCLILLPSKKRSVTQTLSQKSNP